MDKESLRKVVIMLLERESLLETVKLKDMELDNLEEQVILKEKERVIIENSLEMALKEKRSWWDNFLTGELAGVVLMILFHAAGG